MATQRSIELKSVMSKLKERTKDFFKGTENDKTMQVTNLKKNNKNEQLTLEFQTHPALFSHMLENITEILMERQDNKLEAMRTEIKAEIKADYDVKINEMAAKYDSLVKDYIQVIEMCD